LTFDRKVQEPVPHGTAAEVMSMEAKTETDVPVRNFNLRAYLAGGGATVALIAAAVLVFASLGAYVAFEGLPIGNSDDDAAQVAVEQSEAAVTVRGSRAAGGSDAGDRGGEGASAGTGGGGSGDRGSAASSSDLATAPLPASGGESGAGGSGAAPQPVEPAAEPNGTQSASNSAAPGPIPQPVAEAETALGDVTGLPVDLPDAVTAPLDDTLEGVNDALGGAGALGQDLVGGLGG
jgi:hypothetical protein